MNSQQEMRAAKVAPSRTTFNTLLAAAAHGCRADICWLLVEHMQRRAAEEDDATLAPDVRSWTVRPTETPVEEDPFETPLKRRKTMPPWRRTCARGRCALLKHLLKRTLLRPH